MTLDQLLHLRMSRKRPAGIMCMTDSQGVAEFCKTNGMAFLQVQNLRETENLDLACLRDLDVLAVCSWLPGGLFRRQLEVAKPKWLKIMTTYGFRHHISEAQHADH